MGRPFGSTPSSSRWRSGLEAAACLISWLTSSADAPSRSGFFRSISSSLRRQGRNLPSAFNRRRLQLKQKCPLSGLMKPTVPEAAGKREYWAGPLPWLMEQGSKESNERRVCSILVTGTNRRLDAWPNGISSINLTCQPWSLVRRAKSRTV